MQRIVPICSILLNFFVSYTASASNNDITASVDEAVGVIGKSEIPGVSNEFLKSKSNDLPEDQAHGSIVGSDFLEKEPHKTNTQSSELNKIITSLLDHLAKQQVDTVNQKNELSKVKEQIEDIRNSQTLTKKDNWDKKTIIMAVSSALLIITLLLNIGNFYLSISNRKEDQILKELDDFWLEEIITPKIVQPLLVFCNDALELFNTSSITDKQKFETNFSDLKIKVDNEVKVLKGLPGGIGFFKELEEQLEEIEDSFLSILYDDEESNFLSKFTSYSEIIYATQPRLIRIIIQYRGRLVKELKANRLGSSMSYKT